MERIVDQVVNPKVASVFIPQVEDLVYNYLGIPRKRTPIAETAENNTGDLLPTDLEAVSPGSVKSNNGENKDSGNKVQDMEIDSEGKTEMTDDVSMDPSKDDSNELSSGSTSLDKSSIPLPTEEIKLENIPAPRNSPMLVKFELENIELPREPIKPVNVELKNIELPKEPNLSIDIPLPNELCALQSEDSNSSSGSSIRRNMSPLTPVRNFDDENSCDAQQAFENNSDENDHKEPSAFRFNVDTKKANDSSDVKLDKKETEQLSYQFNNQVNINQYNMPMYDDSSNSHNLQIDYESDANTNTSKTTEIKQEVENYEDSKKEQRGDKKSQKSSHRSRDSISYSSSKDKHSSSRDSSRHDKKPSSKDDKSKSSKDRERSKDRSDKKDSSKHKSSHKSSSSSRDKHRSSSSSHRNSSKSSDERKSSSNNKSSDKDTERSKDKSSRDRKDKSSSHREKERDRKSDKKDNKNKKKEKKDTDDHYGLSGRGNHSRRSTDRDSNDGSSSSKASQSQNNSKSTTDSKKENKNGSSKSDNTSTSGESTSQSDKEHIVANKVVQSKPVVRLDNHLETPIANPPRLPFMPDVTLKKPKFANNFEEAKKMMKMRKFLADEQKRMNQEAALLLEFQANVRPSLSQVYSSIPGPELEFACVTQNESEMPQKRIAMESLKVECDAKVSEIVCSLDKPFVMKRKDSKEIINDIIGVPVEQYQHKSIIIETDVIKAPIGVQEINNVKYDENKPSAQLVDDISKHGNTEKNQDSLEDNLAEIVHDDSKDFEITAAAETLSETDVSEILEMKEETPSSRAKSLQYFTENEKLNAELEKNKFSALITKYIENTSVSNKMYVINCDTYGESIVKEVASKFGDYEIVNYHKNGHLVPNRHIVKDVPLCAEISLPINSTECDKSPIFSPVKSECSFELSSDYDAKLDEIVNKKSRQEVMEIILGGMLDEPSKMPSIDYYTELADTENMVTIVEDVTDNTLKRKLDDDSVSRSVLTPNKIRKMSDSDEISSTTEGMYFVALWVFPRQSMVVGSNLGCAPTDLMLENICALLAILCWFQCKKLSL